jgi:hypothetical protein
MGANLYGVIGQGTPEEQTTVYPRDFYWAWVAGHENLRKYSEWQVQACRGQLPESEVTRRILLFVGFGADHIARNAPYTLSVMDLSRNRSLFVPTWEAWFQAFQTTFDLRVPLSTQKRLTLGLSDPDQTSVPLDPTLTFADITGCNPAAAAQCDDQPLSACRSDYSRAALALQTHSPIKGTGSTADCVYAFKKFLDRSHRQADVAETRAMLRYCQDVSPCNSGLGLGFNPSWGMPDGGVVTHFTGREFVLVNQSLRSLGAASIRLAPVP